VVLMDRVEELASTITQLQPEERERLFRLLVERGQLPSWLLDLGRRPEQLGSAPATVDAASTPHRTPDYILTFDGGSRGNPGRGYGSYAVTRVKDGAQRLERLILGDGYTSNEAEYDTLIAALQDLLETIGEAGREAQEFALEIRGDSALVINQLQGNWQAKDPRMKERRGQCTRLLRRFDSVDLKTQPREESVRMLGH
jgi:ribonuclease HI